MKGTSIAGSNWDAGTIDSGHRYIIDQTDRIVDRKMIGRKGHPSVNDSPNSTGIPIQPRTCVPAATPIQTRTDVFAAKYRWASLMSLFGPSLLTAISTTAFGYGELSGRNLNHPGAGLGIWSSAILNDASGRLRDCWRIVSMRMSSL